MYKSNLPLSIRKLNFYTPLTSETIRFQRNFSSLGITSATRVVNQTILIILGSIWIYRKNIEIFFKCIIKIFLWTHTLNILKTWFNLRKIVLAWKIWNRFHIFFLKSCSILTCLASCYLNLIWSFKSKPGIEHETWGPCEKKPCRP